MIIHINMTTMSIYNDRNQTVLYKACVLMLIDKLKYITTGPVNDGKSSHCLWQGELTSEWTENAKKIDK
jgi:hypothetical protein